MTNAPSLESLFPLSGDGLEWTQTLGDAALFWLNLQKLDEAAKCFQALTRLAPDYAAGFIGLCEVSLQKGDPRTADEFAKKGALAAKVNNGDMAYCYILRARAQFALQKKEAAKKLYQDAERVDPRGMNGRRAMEEWAFLETQLPALVKTHGAALAAMLRQGKDGSAGGGETGATRGPGPR